MLKIIIADDEKATRESIKKYIPWSELGVDVVETARDGITALDMAKQIAPDILLTDIRMPKMDGIELAKNIRVLYPECKIVFLSGYSDKEYLKSAITLKAVNYLEKPIKIEDMIPVLKGVIDECLSDKRRNEELDRLSRQLDVNDFLIRQEIALKLIKDNLDPNELIEKYGHSIEAFFNSKHYSTLSVLLNWKSFIDNNQITSVKTDILNSLNEMLKNNDYQYFAGFSGDSVLIIITNEMVCNSITTDHPILHMLDKVSFEKQRKIFTFTAGLGPVVANIRHLADAFRKATAAAKLQFYNGTGKVYHHCNEVNNSFEIDPKLYSAFKDALKKHNMSDAVLLIKRLESDILLSKSNDFDYIRNVFFNLVLIVFETAHEEFFADWNDEKDKNYVWKEINHIETLSDLSKYVVSNMENIFNRTEERYSSNRKINEIMRYVHENYSDSELSIQSVADHVYLSQSYISAFFKKETGKTLNEYITEVRMEKAKKLLLDVRIKQYEVAMKVGIPDANYFSTLFKKYTGSTPTEYREKDAYDK